MSTITERITELSLEDAELSVHIEKLQRDVLELKGFRARVKDELAALLLEAKEPRIPVVTAQVRTFVNLD